MERRSKKQIPFMVAETLGIQYLDDLSLHNRVFLVGVKNQIVMHETQFRAVESALPPITLAKVPSQREDPV